MAVFAQLEFGGDESGSVGIVNVGRGRVTVYQSSAFCILKLAADLIFWKENF